MKFKRLIWDRDGWELHYSGLPNEKVPEYVADQHGNRYKWNYALGSYERLPEFRAAVLTDTGEHGR